MVEKVDEYNKIAGVMLREGRTMAGKSQEEIGDYLEITFQQVQKYERNLNRMSFGTVRYLAEQLGKPLSFFCGDARTIEYKLDDVSSTKTKLNIIQGLDSIEDEAILKTLQKLIRQLGKKEVIANE